MIIISLNKNITFFHNDIADNSSFGVKQQSLTSNVMCIYFFKISHTIMTCLTFAR